MVRTLLVCLGFCLLPPPARSLGRRSRTIAADNLSLWIGWDSHRTENAWNGRLDDVCIYSYALDAKEIGTLYESSRGAWGHNQVAEEAEKAMSSTR